MSTPKQRFTMSAEAREAARARMRAYWEARRKSTEPTRAPAPAKKKRARKSKATAVTAPKMKPAPAWATEAEPPPTGFWRVLELPTILSNWSYPADVTAVLGTYAMELPNGVIVRHGESMVFVPGVRLGTPSEASSIVQILSGARDGA